MPPKSTTRGRGRGRGAAAAATTSGDAVQSSEAESSNAAEPAASAADLPEPAAAPATAAPSDPRPSTTVNDAATSAAQGAPTSSRLPSSTPAPAASSSRGSTSSKFKPKGVRRSEAERARMAEEQLKIQQAKNAEEARRLARLNRGRGRGRGRGRAGFLRGNLRTSAAAGPLAAGISFGGTGRSGHPGGYAFASGSSSGSGFIKGEGEGKEGKGVYGASGIVDNSRINADMLYNYVELSDEEDRASITSGKKKKKAPMPMGIRRVEHKEEEVAMTTAAEIEAQEKAGTLEEEESDEEGLFVGGPAGEDLLDKDEGVWEHALSRPRNKVKIKQEDEMDMDQIPEGIKQPESPEQKKKMLAQSTGDQKPKKKVAAPKDPEAEVIAEDLERMVDLFTLQDHDVAAEDETADRAASALEGHMFLFQFPPVLPPLRAIPRETSARPIKPEPTDDDLVMLDQPQHGAPVNIDLTQDADKVKKEGDGEEGEDGHVEKDQDQLREGGFVGNLIVRKSGKVELSWGGQTLQLMPGTQANFLSTAVLIEEADVKPGDASSQMAGVAYGMGKIQGSFALAPRWGDEEDWVVGAGDLQVAEG
ncbi:hypothetical protein VTK56DRAFT_1953 [Thermocarpiscus australiensis]